MLTLFPLLPLLLALVACVPRYHELGPLDPSALYTPLPTQHMRVDGVDIAYVDSGGSGPPLVFIHGLSSYMGFWEYQLPAFTDTHRVLALDLPGYGASGRPDAPCTPPWYGELVFHWLDELSISEAALAGHSMGGQIALTMALEHPERVSKLVLSAPAGIETFAPGYGNWMKDYWHEGRALHAKEEDLRATFTTLVFNNTDDGVERLLEERVRMGQHPSFEGTAVAVSRSVAGMLDYPVAARLEEVRVPTLLVFGTRDHMIPNPIFNGGRTRAVAQEGQRRIPDAQLVMIPRAGHTVHHDAPEAFNAAVKTFLE
ncbi:MAG: alpha/beta hydrolase [Alphaproteobacteria bacterium]|nr:alpha/beta hydrolase [Alphaproteobacteria bacterium]